MIPDVSKWFENGARWGVGVSGGGDSVALLLMLLKAGYGKQVRVLHFNHKWGAFGDKAETFVGTLAKAKKVEASFGEGKGKASANAEAKGREARLAFFKAECKKHKLAGVMLAHTRSDDGEGFLIRLARGSGLKGLVGMAEEGEVSGVKVVRPLLGVAREDLRKWLKAAKQDWLDDPANSDEAHVRVRVRKVIPVLEKTGIAGEHLAASMAALKRADAALEDYVQDYWVTGLQDDRSRSGELRLDVTALRALPDEVAQRVLAKVQDTLLPGQMPVRAQKRLALLGNIRAKPSGKATLGGVLWAWNGQALAAKREKPAL